MKSIVYGFIFVLLIACVSAADNPDFVSDDDGDKHVVYEDSGNIYYMFNDGSPELVSVGSDPAIDVDSSGNPHIAFVNGNVMYTTKDSEWSTPLTIGGDRTPDISVNPDDVVYIIFKNGGNSGQIQLAIGPTFALSTLESGDYDYQYYRYFWNPKIVAGADNYYVMYEHYYNYGYGTRAYTIYVKDSDGHSISLPGQSGHYGYGESPLFVDGSTPRIVYNVGSALKTATTDFSSWSTTDLGDGSQASIDMVSGDFAITYMLSNNVYYRDSANLSVVNYVAGGTKPVIGVETMCIYYLDAAGLVAWNCADEEEEENPCVDEDGDGYFAYDAETCQEGTDCDDSNENRWRVDYFYYDGDGDEYHAFGAPNMNDNDQISICYGESPWDEAYVSTSLGQDCDDTNPELNNQPDCVLEEPCVDEDGDGYCVEDDCNDNNPDIWMQQVCFRDNDMDGYNHWYGYNCYEGIGEFCYCGNGDVHEVCSLSYYPFTDAVPEGPDCNDEDETIHEGCDPAQVPEFGIIGALAALILVGLFISRRR